MLMDFTVPYAFAGSIAAIESVYSDTVLDSMVFMTTDPRLLTWAK